MTKATFVFLLLFTLGACKPESEFRGKKYEVATMTSMGAGVEIPSTVWDDFEKIYVSPDLEPSVKAHKGTQGKLVVPTDYFPYKVFLVEKTRGILGGKNHRLDFEKGGGNLDLKDYVQEGKGTFYFGFEPDLPMGEKDKLLVYFLSRSMKRQVGHETLGAGCDVYLDISDYFNKAMKEDGLLVNTAVQRHASLLGGTFFMAVSLNGKLWVSQLTIKDSRYKKLQCK